MTRSKKKQKVAEDPVTGDVALPELLNSLQAVCVKVEEQRRHLSHACYTIQHPHSRLHDNDSLGLEKAYHRSVDSAIKAWRSATVAYSTLFATLLNPGEAQPYASWAQKRSNELGELLKSSLLAKASAHHFQLHEDTVEANAVPNISNKFEAEPVNTSNPTLKRDYSSLNGDIESKSFPASTAADHVVPKVEYEDISAEVDARLEAKREKTEAAKKEKKRKRESGESFLEGELDGSVDKPDKKKAKSEVADVESTSIAYYEKRKTHDHRDEENEHGASRKKRKKAKEEP